jgi:hypothetical protein
VSRLVAIALLASIVGAGCKRDRGAGSAPPPKPAASDISAGAAKAQQQLLAAARTVLKECEVTDYGFVRACRGEADKALALAEKSLGVRQTLLVYCRAVADADHRLHALAAARIGRAAFYKTMQDEADPAVLDCLLDAVPRVRPAQVARPLVRAATYMATALRRDDPLRRLLDGASPEVRSTGYEALWANGRLRVLGLLAPALQPDKPLELRLAVVIGFGHGGRLEPAERDKVCALLAPLMTDAEVRVAGPAAARFGELCEQRDRVLQAAEEMVRRGRFDLAYVTAVRGANGFYGAGSTPEQQKRSAALLAAAAQSAALPERVRASALSNLRALDRSGAQALAKQLRGGKDSPPQVRAAAEETLRRK